MHMCTYNKRASLFNYGFFLITENEKYQVQGDKMKKVIKIVLNISFVFYLLALLVLLFLGSRGFLWSGLTMIEYIKNSSNFVPFKTIST